MLELGAGLGASSVAAALCGAFVVSTDKDVHALSLVTTNAAMNGVGPGEILRDLIGSTVGIVTATVLDWDSDESVSALQHEHGPFDVIIGAALQYGKWERRMWSVLEQLAGRNTDLILASAIGELGLCSTESLGVNSTISVQCPHGWSVVRRDSDDLFAMADLRGGPSEFEVTVMARDATALRCIMGPI